jgi:hypothetical protein
MDERAMCQIRDLITETPEEHLLVTDGSPKVHNAGDGETAN